MSLTPTAPRVAAPPARGPVAGPTATPRRVREQARDVVVVMAFSAAASVGVAGGLLLLTQLSGAGH